MVHTPRWRRIWPTLLSASSQAALRATNMKHARSADIHAAIILARTSFDAYLHELVTLRDLPPYVQFATGPGAKKKLSNIRWRLISETKRSLAGNAIVHHESGLPSKSLIATCSAISSSVGLPPPDPRRPWEDLLSHPSVATWACKSVCSALIALETIDHNRTIHLQSTRDSVASAVSPLCYE
jgi:hypothetical protein